ncbi:probable E3 SUMO-protein ligase RNF212 isoform X4 [Pararge aegeria]|uniref:probable E3 SUMO-protein ligase RNF212 isoform X4 n=1 Tax=Pararge aegeria TaxID=116150 RepID=UPI0019D006DB|nr:probable E3 SUMO-protein ligase RNF212 isoform X4 [Pararge aegeria]
MDWIHCNNCYTQLEPGITLYLTSCGHMFCNNCLDNGVQEGTCLVCKVPCSVMKLAPDMNHEIQDYFTDPDDILQKCCEVLQFQRRHRRRLLSYLVQSTKKFYGARTELKRMTELCQKQHKQLREYQKIIKSLESQLSAQPRQTSPFNVPISPGNNVSPNFLQTTPNYKRARTTVSVEPRDPDTHNQESDWQHECAESGYSQVNLPLNQGIQPVALGRGRLRSCTATVTLRNVLLNV